MNKNNMRTVLSALIGLAVVFSVGSTAAQDIHFSQYRQAPLLSNAANTGNFVGDYRAGIIYRNQWSSFIKPFATTSGFFDKYFKKGFLENDSWGAGIAVFSDKAGTAEFSTQGVYGSLAYHYNIGSDGKQRLSIGAQGGVMQKGISNDELKFGSQYTSVFFNDELSSNETFAEPSISYPVIHAGVNYQMNYSERLDFDAGFSMSNLNKPGESFFGADDNSLNTRMSLVLNADYIYSDLISIHPGLIFTGQTKAFEYIIGSDVGYVVKDVPLMKVVAFFGLWYRSTDAIILVPGLAYNNYRAAISYDINVSSLSNASGGRGAIELSLVYIFNTNPKLGIKRSVPCKRL